MKTILTLLFMVVLSAHSQQLININHIKEEVSRAEKSFEKMAAEEGIAKAFWFYADENAVILRENDTLIKGRENIRAYYEKKDLKNITVTWTPDFVEVSDCGTMAWTYGKYAWKIINERGEVTEFKGVFHTVWKKQKDGSWKFVGD